MRLWSLLLGLCLLALWAAPSSTGRSDRSDAPKPPPTAGANPSEASTKLPKREAAYPGLRWDGPRPGSNVVLVVSDTMRRDRVGAYGSPAATPNFDRLAGSELKFERAFSQAPWTKPAIATLFTGQYPSEHGVLSHPQSRKGQAGQQVLQVDVLAAGVTTLAERLKAAGYVTAGFVANPWLDRRLGFAQGFDTYDDSFAAFNLPGVPVTAAAVRWLEKQSGEKPFFLYVHYMDCHRPYGVVSREEAKQRLSQAGPQRTLRDYERDLIAKLVWLDDGVPAVRAGFEPSLALFTLAYDQGVEAFDTTFGVLNRALERRKDWKRTALIVTSDHGEALFERGWDNHGKGLYDDEIAIPLAARLPGVVSEGPLAAATGLIDIQPTLCTYLKLDCGAPGLGRSWLDELGRPGQGYDGRLLLAQGVMNKPDHSALIGDEHTLLWQPQLGPDGKRAAMFTSDDRAQQNDLLVDGKRTPEIERLFHAMTRRAARTMRATEPEVQELDPEQIERLRSLGYVK